MRNDVDQRQECDGCGGDYHLAYVDGIFLCQTCRDEYYRREYPELYEKFIEAEKIDRHNFWKNWVFEALSPETQATIVRSYMDGLKDFAPVFYRQRMEELRKFCVEEYHEEFAQWMDEKKKVREVVE